VTLSLFTTIIGALKSGIELLEERERNYPQRRADALKQRVDRLVKDFYKEYNRDPSTRSDAVLDAITFELRLILSDFTSIVGLKDLPNKQQP
jgi:hypothetical protein